MSKEIEEIRKDWDYFCSWDRRDERIEKLFSYVSSLEGKVKELESDLRLNASMLSKQCDLAREAEMERDHLSKLLIKERMKVVELKDAIGKHEIFKRDHLKVVPLEDEELYRVRREINE